MMQSIQRKAVAEQTIQVQTRGANLTGTMLIPEGAKSIAVFVQADGSCLLNPRNHYLAHCLRQSGIATLLVDLLTLEEEIVNSRAATLHCDLETLALRLIEVTDWLQNNPDTSHLKIDYFGLRRGNHVAFLAATERPKAVRAIVVPGSNLESLEMALPHIKAPTLLIVGGLDSSGLVSSQRALTLLPPNSDLEIVPRSDSLFRESSEIEFVGRLTSQWLHKLDNG